MYLFSICLPFATILIVFGMRYVSQVLQSKARLANEGAYRQVAESAAAAGAGSAALLASIQTAITEVRTRLTAIEKILKDVE
jgi:hypothetical protein